MADERAPQIAQSYIGRITFSQDLPAGPDEFWCWLSASRGLNVQVGSLLTVEGEGERIITVVSDMKYTSVTRDVSTEFYGSGYGSPQTQPTVRPTIIRCAKLRVLLRTPRVLAPPEGRWGVRHVNDEDLSLLSEQISLERRILGGFIKIGLNEGIPESWHPVFLHADFLLGPQGAHMNVSGITGLATKTSYALFIAYSILAWAQANDEKVGVILFNVKRRDFLQLHQIPSEWDKAHSSIEEWAKREFGDGQIARRVCALWESARKNGVDPISNPPDIRYFTYQGDPDSNLMQEPYFVKYGLKDITRDELIAALYRADEEPGEQQINLINAYFEYISGKDVSFSRMMNDLTVLGQQSVSRASRQYDRLASQVPQIGIWDDRTVNAVVRRLTGFLSKASHIVEKERARAEPVKFEMLVDGLNVIQLNRLHDTEKRLLVNAVLRIASEGLEMPENRRNLNRIVVVIDELNKYAPKRWSPIKEQIIDIVARGRDLRLSLIGAQQFASDIDNEVLGNSATKVVGRSDTSEISKKEVYAYLSDLRDMVPYLEKGQMVLYHPVHPTPFIVWFPPPLHSVSLPT